MKLEKYVDKESKRRKTILISLNAIVLISISFLLYKTFASFSENVEFPIMKGQVDYFGNSDVYFAFYNGKDKLEEMPKKDNANNLLFSYGECDNRASIIWDNENWAPLVKNLKKSKTKCTLYFGKPIELNKDIPLVESGDGLYKVSHNDLEELGTEWNKTEYRYAGVNPNNYVSFNNEIWRIIGLVNVKNGNNVEQRIKIVRTDGVNSQKAIGEYYLDTNDNNWTTSKLKDMLNGIYYESGTGDCYSSISASECDFSVRTDLPKGLNDIARKMIDKEVIWNLGGWTDSKITAKQFYEKERGASTGSSNSHPSEWSVETDEGEKHNGIGLIYPSDYGYAVGGEVRNNCLNENLYNYDGDNCNTNDWLKPNNHLWTLSPISSNSIHEFLVLSSGSVGYANNVSNARGVWPTLYLTTSTKIVDGTGDINSPFILSVQ